MRRPHGGHVLGASPQTPFADDLSARQGDLICSQDQLLDLRMVQSWYQSGALKGGLWFPDWAYQEQSAGTAVTAAGQVVGVWAPAASSYSASQTTTANKPLTAITPVTGKPWLTADSTDVLPVVFPSALSVPYTAAMGRRNFLVNSVFAGATSGSPGSIPTSWTPQLNVGALTATQIDSGEYAVGVTVSNARYFFSQDISVSANTNYCLSAYITASSGVSISAALTFYPVPSGASITYWVNGSVVSSSYSISAGDRIACIVAVSGTPGTATARVGIGNYGPVTGNVTFYRVQVNTGATPDDYQKITYGNTPCTVARATPTGVTFSEDENLSSATWNGLIQPYQYNSAVLVADRQLTAREKAVVSRVLGAYVPVVENNLITNSCFDNNYVGWETAGSATLSVVDGSLEANATTYAGGQFLFATSSGGIYFATCDLKNGTATDVRFRICASTYIGTILCESNVITASAWNSVSAVAVASSSQSAFYFRVAGNTGGKTAYLDNVFVRRIL